LSADFFEHQDTARRNTSRLVILFGLAVIAIGLTLYALAVALTGVQGRDPRTGALLMEFDWWDPELLGGVALAVLIVVGGGSLYKIAQLRAGGSVVAEQLGGRLLHPDTRDHNERVLLNVVEEMAIASGTPTPPVYLLEQEPGINAFAAGFSPNDAVVGVTRGAVEQLDRDELQGVIAHEFSHIMNGDMRLNIRLMGVLHGILIIGLIGYFVFRSAMWSSMGRRGRDNSGLAFLALGVGLIVIGSLGTFFGNWIKASVSRQREFLADASAVQFTRNPQGLAAALKRLGGFSEGSHIASPNAPEASHLFFGQALRGGLQSIFATHPPLAERIGRLDPSFSAEQATRLGLETPPAALSAASAAGAASLAGGSLAPERLAVEHAVRDIGSPTPAHLAYASELVRSLPAPLREAAHEPYGARAVVYALVIDRDARARARQLERLDAFAESGVADLTRRLLPLAERLPAQARMPLIDMTLPALRDLSSEQYGGFRENLEELVRADDKIDLFEWTLQRMLLAHLAPHFERVRTPRVKHTDLRSVSEASRVLLSALSLARGGAEPEDAWRRAASALEVEQAKLSGAECSLARIDDALFVLAHTSPGIKKQLLQTCAEYIAEDGSVAVAEAELLRATADTLGCPMPPLLAQA
jgi:Zn-dependent protease with chaperone function